LPYKREHSKCDIPVHLWRYIPIILNENNQRQKVCESTMRRRERYILFFLSLAVIVTGSRAYTVGQDPLWQRALDIASTNERWVPGHVVHDEEVYSRIGIRQEKTETHSRITPLEGSEVEVTFLQILFNGRDITREFTEEFGETMVLEESEYRVEHPFRKSAQASVAYSRLDKTKKIDGSLCVPYAFTYVNERGTWEGTAWLDEKTGTPVLVEGVLVSVPLDEKWYTISGLEITTTFATDETGAWYPRQAVVDSQIEVVVRQTQTYRSRVKETYTFSEYWWYD
jgi:hypothetical protein